MISSGAFGAVHRATCKTSGNAIAVKVIRKVRNYKIGKRAFETMKYQATMEVECLARLRHPNVIEGLAHIENEAMICECD